ncbi:MAG: hypothetical protein IJS15_08235 [Victivallales bacterium]|nr:hypothetical protein [Victivallales bacterium]
MVDLKEQDLEFMERVAEAYQRPGTELSGSLRAVAQKFGITRTKVRKILITLGAMESPLPEEAITMQQTGHSVCEIAEKLGLSVATVSTYLPYATVMYKGEIRSASALRQDAFRSRLATIASKQIFQSKNNIEEETMTMTKRQKTTKVMRLKLELQGFDDESLAVLSQYCGAKEGYSREILAPAEMTLHGLHYAIMRLFGWLNGHLHRFTLPQKSMDAFTRGQFFNYLSMVGLYFRSPVDIEEQDIFWDDDYEGESSFRNWLRKKYTAPFHFLGVSEQFMAARRTVSVFIKEHRTLQVIPSGDGRQSGYVRKQLEEIKLDEAGTALDGGLGDLVERLTLEEILSGHPATTDEVSQLCREAAMFCERNVKALDETVSRIFKMKVNEAIAHRMMANAMLPLNPKVLPLTDRLTYEFDFGDGWEISIALCGVYDSDNTDDEKLSPHVKQVMETGRPLCIALDGNLPLVQDVGGIYGYCDFLTTINSTDADAKRDMLEWARGLGWTGRRSTPEKLL